MKGEKKKKFKIFISIHSVYFNFADTPAQKEKICYNQSYMINGKTLGIKTLIFYIIQRTLPSFLILLIAVYLPNITRFFILNFNLNINTSWISAINRFGNIAVALLFLLFMILLLIGIISSLIKYFGTVYSLDDYAFRLTKGIIGKNEISIPYKHIENVDVQQSIFFRIFGLSRMVIFSAGNPQSDKNDDSTDQVFDIIDTGKAEYLKSYLLKKAEIEEVVEVNK